MTRVTSVWIVERTNRVLRDGEWRTTSPSYWYGPRDLWGTTSGPLEERGECPAYSVAQFPTRKQAEDAIRSVYGAVPKRMRPIRLADAVAARTQVSTPTQ